MSIMIRPTGKPLRRAYEYSSVTLLELESFAAVRADEKNQVWLPRTYLDVGLQMFNDCFVGIEWPIFIHI